METSTDVLILGAGASGLSAALAAHAQGASVKIIDKYTQLGGTAAISGGIVWMPNNHVMQAEGLKDSAKEGKEYFMSLNHGDIREPILEAFLQEGPKVLSKLEQMNALSLSMLNGYPDYYLDRPGAKPEGGRALDNEMFSFKELGKWSERVYTSPDIPRLKLRETPLGGASGIIEPEEQERRLAEDERGWGQALIARLLKACLDRGIEPVLGCSVENLQQQSNGSWHASLNYHNNSSVTQGEPSVVAKRGVIIATGGFEWNDELRQAFLRGPLTAPASPPMNQGDGLKLAMSVGAGLSNMTSAWWVPTLSIPDNNWIDGSQRALPILIERTLPHTILVNRSGQRFCNEACNYSALAGAFHSFDPNSYDYKNLPAYLIFDQQYLSKYPFVSVMPGQEVPSWITQANTLTELAAKIKVNGDALVHTIGQFNQGVADGKDEQFDRGVSAYDRFYGDRSREGALATLGDLSQSPYYACEIKMGALGTNGGILTDEDSQVLDAFGKKIIGLYAAGNVMAGATGSVYAGAGGTLGPALTFGFLAGQNAANRV